MGSPPEVLEELEVGMDEIATCPTSWLAAHKAVAMNSMMATQHQHHQQQHHHHHHHQTPRRTESERWGNRKNMWQLLILGQVLSMLIALASMSAASLDDRGVNLPCFMNLINYCLLTVAFLGSMLVSRRSLSLPWWRYAVYALVDVEANTLAVLSYRYTSITSITMLDAFSIPSVMVLSRLFLFVRYTKKHFVGVVLCLGGLALTVLSDLLNSDPNSGHTHAIKGDVLCILGAAMYGASNVMQENFVKNHDRVEFLGMAGAFGVILSGVQTAALEWNELAEVVWTDQVVLFVIGYSTSLFVLYCWTSLFLQASDAALFNLSLLTADIYAFIFALEVEKATTSWLFFLAAAIIFCGIIVYHSQPPVTLPGSDLTLARTCSSSSSGGGGGGVGRLGGGLQMHVGGTARHDAFAELRSDAGDGLSLTSTSHGSDIGSESGPDMMSASTKLTLV